VNYEWPPTPDVADAVLARVGPRPRRWPLAALAAGALLLPAGAVAGVTDFFGLRSVDVRVGPPRAVPTPAPGTPVTVAEAGRIAGFAPVLPPALGTPDSVRARPGRITLRYGALRLDELTGALTGQLLEKSIQEGSDVRRVPGGAYFPRPHFLAFLRPDGSIQAGRTAHSTLVLERGDLVLRLEGRELGYARAARLLS
jgi:hypothetical protein